ncbi:MAG: universal stress protein [Prevotellaceae bacterium]|jgi:nucleotide-binding universal stress UspA family protein|nr:universal stress protein [Prevotellaceae bacterium]
MEDKLVTLAIRTYQRAQMIKSVLEEHGITTVIHNLNLENPEMAVGVRIRISESDLPQALKIIEEVELAWEEDKGMPKKTEAHVLIPIDFADHVEQTIDFGFYYAEKLNAEVTFLYVYYTPAFTISSNYDVSTYSISDNEMLRKITGNANADVENMKNHVNRRINQGEIPKRPFNFLLKEGVPEEEILDYCKKNRPDLVLMGTHGKKISNELIGSVAAEVIESCSSPVLAIPIETELSSVFDIKKMALLTNFDQKDLIAIDKAISFFAHDGLEMHFIHTSDKNETWDEIVLSGIKTYFSSHYPDLKVEYALLCNDNPIKQIRDYLRKNTIDIMAFNAKKRNIFARLFNRGLAYKMVLNTDIPLFVTHI